MRDGTVSYRFYNSAPPYTNTCAGITEWDYNQIGNPVFQLYSLLPVQKGDSVQFLYITDLYPEDGVLDTLTLLSYDSLSYGWDLWFGKCNNSCNTWSEMLYATVIVVDTTVTFTPPASNTAYPRYPGHNNSTDKNDTLSLQVQTKFNGSLAKNVWVRIDTTVLADSGGHSHGGNRPLGTFLLPRTPPQSGYDSVRTFTRQTDSLGNLNFKYIASQFGGIERVKAERLSDTTSFDTVQVVTKVGAMIDFTHTQTNEWNYSGSSGPTTYKKCPGTLLKHPMNHYILGVFDQSLQEIIVEFFQYTGTPRGGGQYLKLGINDMSLPKGGLFDICNNWQPGHKSHRKGTSVDIDSTNTELFNNPGHYVPLQHYQIEELTRIVQHKNTAALRAKEETIHYEFPDQ